MSTDPSEFEHPIDGTGESVTAPTPPLVDVIAAALDTHHRIISQSLHQGCLCGWVGEVLGYDHAAHQARAVLTALEQAGAVEWGVQYERLGLDGAETHILETANKSHAESVAELAQPSIGWNHRVASRITGPWTAVQ